MPTTTLHAETAIPTKPLVQIRTLDITVLMGGPSEERQVSLNSGKAIAHSLGRLGHRVHCSDILPDDVSALDVPADLVFIALHGTFGEDGQIQSILESRGIPFVGSGSEASQRAMDKVQTKQMCCDAGIPTPPFHVVMQSNLNQATRCWRLPVMLKPVDQGSSVDTMIARDAFGFQASLQRIVNKYGSCLIEQYIKGPELTVGILGDRALPVCQIVTPREFYDYTAKYLTDSTEYLFAPCVSEQLLNTVQELSLQAHRLLGCREFSRVDWMVDAKTMQPYLLEINTIPGFTDHSLLPKAAAQVGIGFDELCQQIVDLAMRRACD